MNNDISLLPPNSSRLEKKLSQTFADIRRIPVPINLIWSAQHCPPALLPWLAWSLSVDEWDDEWTEENKRQAILNSIFIHKHKGTVASIRRVLASAGYGDIEIVENLDLQRYDGSGKHNADHFYGDENLHWAMYRIYLKKPITIEQAEQVKTLLANTAPARCWLMGMNFEQALNLYNNHIIYDGTYSHGVA